MSRGAAYPTAEAFMPPRISLKTLREAGSRQIAACKPWLAAEVQVVKPEVVVALGATAAQTLMSSGSPANAAT